RLPLAGRAPGLLRRPGERRARAAAGPPGRRAGPPRPLPPPQRGPHPVRGLRQPRLAGPPRGGSGRARGPGAPRARALGGRRRPAPGELGPGVRGGGGLLVASSGAAPFGIARTGRRWERARSYLRVRDHDFFPSLRTTRLVMLDGAFTESEGASPLTFVPP